MKLVIERDRWLRGEGSSDSYLLRDSDGKMCCLGFYALACGLMKIQIANVTDPAGARRPTKAFEDALVHIPLNPEEMPLGNSQAAKDLMSANDSIELEDNEREQRLERLFAKIGVQVEFR